MATCIVHTEPASFDSSYQQPSAKRGGARSGAGRKPSEKTLFLRSFIGPMPQKRRVGRTDEERLEASRIRARKRSKKVSIARDEERRVLGLAKHERTTRRNGCCTQCGAEFVSILKAKFCSNQCRTDYYNEQQRIAAMSKVSPRACRECGCEFTPPYGVKLKGFCSQECRSGYRAKIRNTQKEQKIATDPVYRMTCYLRTFINNALRRAGRKKNLGTDKILGCDFAFFREHIEKQFFPGMSWDCRSEWHIDHIVPMASAKSLEEAVKLNHFTNLRPIWAKDNLRKGAQIMHLI